jgi:predicted nucleotidyltransferase
MPPAFDAHHPGLDALCRRFHVRRLDLFGSAARGTDFDPARSDLDLLVAYEPAKGPPALADFLALREALEDLLGRKVDLAMESAIRNPYLRASIDAARVPLHGA